MHSANALSAKAHEKFAVKPGNCILRSKLADRKAEIIVRSTRLRHNGKIQRGNPVDDRMNFLLGAACLQK